MPRKFDERVKGKHRRSDEEIEVYAESKSKEVKVKFNGSYTICDVHRKIWDLTKEDSEKNKEEILFLLERAYVFAKKMDAKLRMYNMDYHDDWYEEEKKKHS